MEVIEGGRKKERGLATICPEKQKSKYSFS
jgi:hypothetical protein